MPKSKMKSRMRIGKRLSLMMMAWVLVLSTATAFAKTPLCLPTEYQTSPFFVHFKRAGNPTLVVIHGGFSSTSQAALFCTRFAQVLGDKYNIISVDYRFSSFGGGELVDVKRGIELARKLWKTRDRDIHLIGASHGGYLALMTASEEEIGSIIDAYGPTQWLIQWEYVKEERPDLLNKWRIYLAIFQSTCRNLNLKFVPCLWERSVVNPQRLKGLQEPLLILHGDKDRVVPLEESILLAKSLRRRGTPTTLWIVHGRGHGFPLWKGEAFEVLKGFLERKER